MLRDSRPPGKAVFRQRPSTGPALSVRSSHYRLSVRSPPLCSSLQTAGVPAKKSAGENPDSGYFSFIFSMGEMSGALHSPKYTHDNLPDRTYVGSVAFQRASPISVCHDFWRSMRNFIPSASFPRTNSPARMAVSEWQVRRSRNLRLYSVSSFPLR